MVVKVLEDILFVVVTCSRDRRRDSLSRKLIHSLNRENNKHNFANNILFFDNASIYKKAFSHLKFKSRFVLSKNNVGYWSALLWSLENAPRLFNRSFSYVHPIESDLILYNLERLEIAKKFLAANSAIKCVRTQEFSIAQQKRFFKNSKSFFKKSRSSVADYNGVTQEKVRFIQAEAFPGLFVSNWHAKVPALHEYVNLLEILTQMKQTKIISEHLFMSLYSKRCREVGVLDGGVYYTTSYKPVVGELTGSYTTPEKLKKSGYLATRVATMLNENEFEGMQEYAHCPWL